MVTQARASLAKRLAARRAEIEQTLLARAYGVSDPSGVDDPEYAQGLRAAVAAALEYGLASIERGDEHVLPVPPILLLQARVAARSGISLDTVLRRYVAGYGLLSDYLIEEAAISGVLKSEVLKTALRIQTVILDRLLAEVSEEYARETDVTTNAELRRIERVQRLLDGELLDTSPLQYEFANYHLGVVVSGCEGLDIVRRLKRSLDCRSLVVPRGETSAWAWFGARFQLDFGELQAALASGPPLRGSIAVGEPGKGLRGWRLSHEQARAAQLVAMQKPGVLTRYVDVARIASMLQDDLLCASLHQVYLAPLEGERDGGAALRETLRAYLSAERNISSAAALLGVSRRTVANRLRVIEERIERPLNAVLPDVEAALALEVFDRHR
jgi:hypothetical protein